MITYDPIFEAAVRQLAPEEADTILGNLHIGSDSAQRFRDFIKVPDTMIEADDDEDNEDNEDNEDDEQSEADEE